MTGIFYCVWSYIARGHLCTYLSACLHVCVQILHVIVHIHMSAYVCVCVCVSAYVCVAVHALFVCGTAEA